MGLTNSLSDLLPGTLELLILKSLVSSPKHGYAIVEHLHEKSGALTLFAGAYGLTRDPIRYMRFRRHDGFGLFVLSLGLAAAVTALADRLKALVSMPIILQDERLTSREAESLLARRHKDWRARKPLLDAASAAVILQDFLDSRSDRSNTATDLAEDRQS